MTTKNGKHHYKCHLTIYRSDDTIFYEKEEFVFIASDAIKHLENNARGYAKHNLICTWENLIDLDGENR